MPEMMNSNLKLAAALWAAACTGLALDNSVVIREAGGEAQTNRPVTVSRVFAEGEIAQCAQAYVNDVGVTTQTDVRTRWTDGSLRHALVTFRIPSLGANSSVKVDFRNTAACNNTGVLTLSQILAAGWDAEMEASSDGVVHTVSAKMMLASIGSISSNLENLKARYLLRGPLVTQVLIEDRDPASRAFDFGWEFDPAGNTWKSPASAQFRSVHPLFVVTLYPDTPSAGQYAVRVEYIARHAWMDRMQTQYYALTLRGAGGEPLYSLANWRAIPKSAWRVTRWVANEPGSILVDYNLPYLIYSKATPSFDLTLTPSSTYMDYDLGVFTGRVGVNGEASFCSVTDTYCMLWYKGMGTAGGRKDIGLTPGWYVSYLRSMAHPAVPLGKKLEAYEKFLVGLGNAAAAFPFHYQEHLTDRCYVRPDSETPNKFASAGACTANAAGLPLSITARPTFVSRRNNNEETAYSVSAPEDRIAYACTSTTSPCQVPTSSSSNVNANMMGWESENDLGHLPDWFYIPYLITGDYFYLEEMQFAATFYMSIKVPLTASGINARDLEKGLQNQHNNPRASAWWMRTAVHAAVMTPDGTAAKAYLLQKIRNNIALREGTANLTTGYYYNDPVRGPIWTRGRNVIAGGKDNPLGFQDLNQPDICNQTINEGLKRNTCNGASGFMHYYFVHAFGRIAELLPEARPVGEYTTRIASAQASSAGYPPHMAAEFHHAVMGADNSAYLTSWAGVASWAATRCYLANAISASSSTAKCYSIGDALNLQSGRFLKIGNEIVRYSGTAARSAYNIVVNPADDTVTVSGSEAHGYAPGYGLSFTGSSRTVSLADTGTGTLTTSVAHGYPETHGVRFTVSGGTLPAPLMANTTYYVVNSSSSSFQVSSTRGGAPVSLTSSGSGTITVTGQPTSYFVLSPSTGSFQLSTSPGGAPIDFRYDQTIALPTVTYDCNNGCLWTVSSLLRGAKATEAQAHAASAPVDMQYFAYSDSNANDAVGGYSHVFSSAVSFAFRQPRGGQAWEWTLGNWTRRDLQQDVLQWAYAPRQEIGGLTVSPGASQLLFRFTAPAAGECRIRVAASPPSDTSDAGDATVSGIGLTRWYTAGGLTPSTQYFYRLTCGTARLHGSAATLAGGGPVTVSLALAPPQGRGIAAAVVNYGLTPALGNQIGPQSCSSTCTVNLPANDGQVLYYDVRYRNALGETVAAGSVERIVARPPL
jgi:hypothetical protein